MRSSQRKAPDGKATAYWRVGQRIQAEALTQDVGYYSAIIADLSRDLHLSTHTLYDSVQFFQAHKSAPEAAGVTWSHHRVLLRLSSSKERAYSLKRIDAEKLSARALEASIASEAHLTKAPPS